jgi:hypothetical protein
MKTAIVMWLDHVGNAQGIDVALKPRWVLVHHLGKPVAIHRVDDHSLLQRKAMKVLVSFCETDAVGRLAGRDNDLADPKFHRKRCGHGT